MKKIVNSIITSIIGFSLFINISVYLYLAMPTTRISYLPVFSTEGFITGQIILLIFCVIIIFVTNYEYPAEKGGDNV